MTGGLIAAAWAVVPGAALAFELPTAEMLGLTVETKDVLWLAVTGGFAVTAWFGLRAAINMRDDDTIRKLEARVSELRTALDRSESMLGSDDQRTIVWDNPKDAPRVIGSLPERVGAPQGAEEFLATGTWLEPDSVTRLEAAIEKLRRNGEGFQITLTSRENGIVEVTGRTSGRRTLARFRELTGERRSFAELKEQATVVVSEMTALRALAENLPFPVWRRNEIGRIVWVNNAYVAAIEAQNADTVIASGAELLGPKTRDSIRDAHKKGRNFDESVPTTVAGERRHLHIQDVVLTDGSIGIAIDESRIDTVREELVQQAETHAGTLDQLTAAVAVFGADRKLRFNNTAFRSLWDMPTDFLESLPEEGAILDQLRADRKLPEQANYREWRDAHLDAYAGNATREEWWHLPDGRSIRVVAISNADGGMTYIYENVTEQLSLESRVNVLSQLQGETLDHLAEGVAVFGSDGKLRLFNPVFADIWRLSPDMLREEPHISEIIENCAVIFSDMDVWEGIRIALTDLDNTWPLSGRMDRPDGSVVEYSTVTLAHGMTMLIFVDVTDSARVQKVLSERNEALEAADRLKSDFIQHVSYELRSPLTSIIGFAEMIADETIGTLNPQQSEYMEHITASSSSLMAIVNDILDLATVDAGIMALNIAEVDIRQAAEASVEGLRDRLEAQSLTLNLNIPDEIGTFRADEQRVRQILFNLVANAVRFSDSGGSIEISGERDAGWVIYCVRDFGSGIPESMIPSIFKPFEGRGAQGRRRGAGLGLSIVKSLVELHGGTIHVESKEGEGTTVTVRLPAMPDSAAVAAE
ncbi:MAG TPA: ATP-binding protein [Afifellaceae bacterium]|nr:ATP-binding protein [Afifellaceae bacterium]